MFDALEQRIQKAESLDLEQGWDVDEIKERSEPARAELAAMRDLVEKANWLASVAINHDGYIGTSSQAPYTNAIKAVVAAISKLSTPER